MLIYTRVWSKVIYEGYYFYIYLSLGHLGFFSFGGGKGSEGKEILLGFTNRTLNTVLISTWAVDHQREPHFPRLGFVLPVGTHIHFVKMRFALC